MKNLFAVILLFVFMFFSEAFSQFDNIGTSAANFLKIPVGSRGESLGGAFIAQVDDPTALYWNVAGLSFMQRNEIMFSQNDWVLDISHSFLGVGIPMGDAGTLGVQVSYLSMGEMKETTFEKPEGTGATFTSYDAVIGIGYARKLTDKFAIGIQTKFVQEVIAQASANALAFDIGAIFYTGFHGLKIGVTISNFGTQMKLDGRNLRVKIDPYPIAGSNPNDVVANLDTQPWSLPLCFQIGASIETFRSEQHALLANVVYKDERDFRPILSYGFEYAFDNFVFLRGGMTDRYQDVKKFYSDPALTFGAGIKMLLPDTDYIVKFDYAYSDLKRLEQAHRITVGLQF